MISIKSLTVAYDAHVALANVFLELPAGRLYGVLGPNGAGKSTLFKSILGLVQPTAGEVTIDGYPVATQQKRMAYIPQRGDVDWQFPATVLDVALMGRYPHRSPWQRITQEDRDLAMQALEDMGIGPLKNRQIGELSGGQQQRVFIARALAQQADLLFFDEPFVGVDISTEEKIMDILHRLRNEGRTLLVVHHDLAKVKEYFDHVILVNQRIIAFGPTEHVFTEENISRAYGGTLNILQRANRSS